VSFADGVADGAAVAAVSVAEGVAAIGVVDDAAVPGAVGAPALPGVAAAVSAAVANVAPVMPIAETINPDTSLFLSRRIMMCSL